MDYNLYFFDMEFRSISRRGTVRFSTRNKFVTLLLDDKL